MKIVLFLDMGRQECRVRLCISLCVNMKIVLFLDMGRQECRVQSGPLLRGFASKGKVVRHI